VHRCRQHVIKRTRDRWGGGGREAGVHRHKLNVGMPVSLGIHACWRGFPPPLPIVIPVTITAQGLLVLYPPLKGGWALKDT